MKDYYGELKQFYEMKKSTELLAKLEKLKAANNEIEIIKLYNDAKKLGLKESKDKFTKSKLKQYIKEVIVETLS
jgi:ribosomal protein L7/L12